MIFILQLILLASCDAPRNNPFDPYNEDSPELPSSQEEVFLPIAFSWKKYTPGFTFSYLLQIFTNEIEPQFVSQKAFSSTLETYEYGSYLNAGHISG